MDARKNRTADMSMYQREQTEQEETPEERMVRESQITETLAQLRGATVVNRKKRRWH